MTNFINLLMKNQFFWIFIVLCAIVLLIFIASIIKRFFYNILKLVLITYLIYFPVGLYMAVYYWITTKSSFSNKNIFTLAFIYLTVSIIIVILISYLNGIGSRYEYRISNRNKLSNLFFNMETLDAKYEIYMFSIFYCIIGIGIYSLISLIKSLII
jgi:hypothetical protein